MIKRLFSAGLCLLLFLAPAMFVRGEETAGMRAMLDAPVDYAEKELKAAFPGIDFTFGDAVHDWYKWLLFNLLSSLPPRHVENLESIGVHEIDLDRRGVIAFSVDARAYAPRIRLRLNPIEFPIETGFSCKVVRECLRVTDPLVNGEFVAVGAHEIGHAVDLGKSTQGSGAGDWSDQFKDGDFRFYTDDPSLRFYSLCFADEHALGPRCGRGDFVSGYAKTDAFEDFAEAFAVYMLDGMNFLERAEAAAAAGKPVLMEKYAFLRDIVFDGREYHLPQGKRRNAFTTYDATRRRFDLKFFLAIF